MKKAKRRRDGIWYRNWDSAWYATIGGRKTPLRDESGEKIRGRHNEAAAKLAYHRLMVAAAEGRAARDGEAPTAVEILLDRYEANPNRLDKWIYEEFATFLGMEFPASSVTPKHVYDFVSARPDWSQNTRMTVITRIKAAFNYAVKITKRLPQNPIADVKAPPPVHRIEIFTPEQVELILKEAPQPLAELCWFLCHTGCRIGEAVRLEFSHFRDGNPHGQFVLSWQEHKTGRRTAKPRHIILPAAVTEFVRQKRDELKEGKVLRSHKGGPWSTHNARVAFRNLRRRLGLPPSLTLHCFRHTFATRHIGRGVPASRVAAWLGDTIQVVEKVYWHAIHEANRELYRGIDDLL